MVASQVRETRPHADRYFFSERFPVFDPGRTHLVMPNAFAARLDCPAGKSSQHCHRVFKVVLDRLQQVGAKRPVNHAVIHAQRD